ncbi:hypothetical protein ACEOHC_003894 [Salmonella enterica]
MSVYEFMGNSPILTFCLAALAFGLLRALFRFITVIVNGYPPMWCDSEGRFRAEKD